MNVPLADLLGACDRAAEPSSVDPYVIPRRERMAVAFAAGFASRYGPMNDWADDIIVRRAVGLADALIAELDKA